MEKSNPKKPSHYKFVTNVIIFHDGENDLKEINNGILLSTAQNPNFGEFPEEQVKATFNWCLDTAKMRDKEDPNGTN